MKSLVLSKSFNLISMYVERCDRGIFCSLHFVSYKQRKLRGTRRKGRYSAVKSSQFIWSGQYKKCVQYDFKFTPENRHVLVSQLKQEFTMT